MTDRGDATVAVAGLYSHTLGRVAMTMQERGDASVAGAGLYSHTLIGQGYHDDAGEGGCLC